MKNQTMDLRKGIGKKLSFQRCARKLTQSRFAEQLSISRTSLALIESGKRGLTLARLYQIAQVLGIEVHLLLPTAHEINPLSSNKGLVEQPTTNQVQL